MNARLYLATGLRQPYIPGAPSEQNNPPRHASRKRVKEVLEARSELIEAPLTDRSIIQMAARPTIKKFDESKSYHKKHIDNRMIGALLLDGVIDWTLAFRATATARRIQQEQHQKAS